MGEYVGIHPEGADALIEAMNSAKDLVSEGFIADVKAYLGVAQSDAVLEAQGSFLIYQRYRTFLETYAKELKWREDVIVSAPDATVDGDRVYGYTQFDSEKQATESGTEDGDMLQALLEDAQQTGDSRAVYEFLAEHEQDLADPAYAAAFLQGMGKEAVADLLVQAADYFGATAGEGGLTPEQVEKFTEGVGPLLTAINVANATGRLPADIKDEILSSYSINSLGAMIKSGAFSDDFLRDLIAEELVIVNNRPPEDRNLQYILEVFADKPEILQQLLADEDCTRAVLEIAAGGTANDAAQQSLLQALDQVLDQGFGDEKDLQEAWSTIVEVAGAEFRDELNLDADLNELLTEHFLAYLPYAGYQQGVEWAEGRQNAPVLTAPDGPQLNGDISTEDLALFMGGLAQNETSLNALTEEAIKLIENGDGLAYLTPENLAELDLENLDTLEGKFASELGAVALLYAAFDVGDADETARKDATARITSSLVTGAATSWMGAAGIPAGTAAGELTSGAFDDFATWYSDKIAGDEQIDPNELSEQLETVFAGIVQDAIDQGLVSAADAPSQEAVDQIVQEIIDQYDLQRQHAQEAVEG